MGLITVFFPGGELGYRKAIINELDKGFFVGLGAEDCLELALNIEELEVEPQDPEEIEVEVSEEPDKGHGAPGSIEFHRQWVMSFEDIDEVIGYVLQVTDIKLPKRGKLETIQKKAMEAIEESLSDGESK